MMDEPGEIANVGLARPPRRATALAADDEVAEASLSYLVLFEGAVNQDHIGKLYGAADIFCIASVAEGIPVVLMEAMAMQIACVTTHITGIPELIRNGADGLLVAPSDVDGMVKALAQLMDDPELRERLGRSARARVLEHYDLKRSVEKLGAIFVERIATDRHRSAV